MTGSNIKSKDATKKGGILNFFKGVKAEIKRITWPSFEHTKKAFIAVIVFTLMYTILVGGLDSIFSNLFKMILNMK